MSIWEQLREKIRGKKVPPTVRTTEEIREEILKFLFSKYKNAYDTQEISVSERGLRRGLKKIGLQDSEITRGLIYLTGNGWIEEKKVKHESEFEGTEIVNFYRISIQGINYFEGPSKFQRTSKYDGINITNINGALVIGDGNVVQSQYLELHNSLDALGEGVRHSSDFSDEEKWNIQADIETIKSQLLKLSPDKGIIQKTWEAIKVTVTAAAFIQLITNISQLISKYFS